MHCKRCAIVLGIILGISMTSSLAEGETIVHTERIYQEDKKASEESHLKGNMSTAQDHEDIAISGNDEISENKIVLKPKDIENGASANKMETYPITSEHYFDSFEKVGPDFAVSFGEGGDLAGTSSLHFCSSKFIMKNSDTDENITFIVYKKRVAWVFGADTMLYITCTWDLNAPIIVGQNRYPLFELNMNGESETIRLRKLSQYSRKSFIVITGNVHFLDALYGKSERVTMLLPLSEGGMARIPIPAEVIEQWEQVSSADLKKMRREYDSE